MQVYTADQVAQALPYEALVTSLREAFRNPVVVPPRSVYEVGGPAPRSAASFVLMPAWRAGSALAVKLATIFPENPAKALPTVHAHIVLFDGETGVPLAVMDGTEVTRRRTAAASALAAAYLAREDAERLLIVGTGAQAPHNALAHAAVRPIRHVHVWGRSPAKAATLAEFLRAQYSGWSVQVSEDLGAAARQADIISCATTASEPLLRGEWLMPGAFVDLVGAYKPDTRECDDETARRCRIYVDTLSGAMAEAGDVLIPMQRGVIRESDIAGDLHGLCRNEVSGRRTALEITLFKSVGTAIEDLAAAQLVVAHYQCVQS